jgi:Zc3h12a-like Ribonuclease NYN domain
MLSHGRCKASEPERFGTAGAIQAGMAKELILIDGANVAWEAPSSAKKPRVSNIIAVKQALEELGFAPIIIVDASLKHHVDDPEQLEGLFGSAQVLQAPSGTMADYFLLKTAEERDAQVVSNDEFDQFKAEFPWIKRRRVPFMIVSGSVQLYLPKLDLPLDGMPEPMKTEGVPPDALPAPDDARAAAH